MINPNIHGVSKLQAGKHKENHFKAPYNQITENQ
jgi:hypothetical protein